MFFSFIFFTSSDNQSLSTVPDMSASLRSTRLYMVLLILSNLVTSHKYFIILVFTHFILFLFLFFKVINSWIHHRWPNYIFIKFLLHFRRHHHIIKNTKYLSPSHSITNYFLKYFFFFYYRMYLNQNTWIFQFNVPFNHKTWPIHYFNFNLIISKCI